VEDINPAFEQAAREQAQGLVVLSSPLIFTQRSHIADAALNARLPSINLFNSFPIRRDLGLSPASRDPAAT
jgi:hypothetical protein